VLLVDTNVNQVHLEVSEFKNKALDEDRFFVSFLCLVIFHLGGSSCYIFEFLVSDSRQNSLSNRSDHIHVACRIKNGSFVG
jgi:hypothetical protein